MRKTSVVIMACAFFCVLSSGVMALQNGNLNWGYTDFADAVRPPMPGFTFNNIVSMYHGQFVDSDGHKLEMMGDDHHKLNSVSYAPQFIYTGKPLGKFVWGMQAMWPMTSLNVDSDMLTTGGGYVADPNVGPFVASVIPFSKDWLLHWSFEVDSYIPLGYYDKNKSVNPSANHWTFEPWIAFTLQMPNGFMLDTRQHVAFNTKNRKYVNPTVTLDYNEHDYKPGVLYHFNYMFSKSFDFISPFLRVGVGGYYGKQLTEDRLDGEKVRSSKERVFAIGPAIQYTVMDSSMKKPSVILSFKGYQESSVKNRTEGTRVVFRAIIPF